MESMLSAMLIFVFLFFTCIYLLKLVKPSNKNLPPSPPKLPIIGNLHQLGALPHRSFQALSAKYGPLMLLHLGKVPTLVVSSSEAVKEITKADQDVIFSGRPRMRVSDSLSYDCTDIAFSPYGEYWRQARKICVLELLSQKRVQEFHCFRIEEVEKLVTKIRDSCRDGVAVNVSKLIISIANNVVSRSAVGRVFELDGNEKSLGVFARKAMDLLSAFCFKDLFPYLAWMDHLTGFVSNLRYTSGALHDALDQVIQEHEVSMKDDDSDRKDIVDILLNLEKTGNLGMHLTRNNLKAILMDMFVGGSDTSAATLEWAMAELVRNPSTMKKAQEEVRRIVGNKSKVTEADVSEMSYLKWVVKETLRLHAPAMILRETSTNTKVLGYDIPAKTRVLINTWAIQRDPTVWDRPDEFMPERFSDMAIDFKDKKGEFIPFGCGRRICPGMTFAMAGAEFVLANLLCWFDWNTENGENARDLDMSEASSFVVYKKKHLILVPTIYSA